MLLRSGGFQGGDGDFQEFFGFSHQGFQILARDQVGFDCQLEPKECFIGFLFDDAEL